MQNEHQRCRWKRSTAYAALQLCRPFGLLQPGVVTFDWNVELIFSIAGVGLKIDSGHLTLPAEPWKHEIRRRFVVAGKEHADDDREQIDVFLTADPAPGVTAYQRIFDSRDSWSIYSHHDETYVTDQYPPFSAPVWTARCRLNHNRVDIFCSSEIIDPQTLTLAFNPVAYPLDQILLMNYLALHDGVIMHAAGWALNGSGWVFPGKSGDGKTTLTRCLSGLRKGQILSDDRIVIRRTGQTFRMYGTPWPGEGGYAVNRGVKLNRLVFLSKGSVNKMMALEPAAVVSRLMPVLSIPWYDKEKVVALTAFCDLLIKRVPAYELTFRADSSVMDFLKAHVHEFNQSL